MAGAGRGGRELRAFGEIATHRPRGRRLSDKLLVAFHHACDERDHEVAGALLRALEKLVTRAGPSLNRRKDIDSLVAAHERLWMLSHPDDAAGF